MKSNPQSTDTQDELIELIREINVFRQSPRTQEELVKHNKGTAAIKALVKAEALKLLDRLESSSRQFYEKKLDYAPDGDPHKVEARAVPLSALQEERKRYE